VTITTGAVNTAIFVCRGRGEVRVKDEGVGQVPISTGTAIKLRWCCGVVQYVAVCCSVLQCGAVCCSVVQYVTVCRNPL